MTSAEILSGGFSDPAVDAARAFRAMLEAMAEPGRIVTLSGAGAPAPLSPAAAAALLVLADGAAPVHLAAAHDTAEMRAWLAFHTGARVVARAEAAFALGTWASLLPLADYAPGTAEYPDRSATLIIEVPRLDPLGARLSGPGIRTQAELSLPDLAAFQANAALFPMGLDFLFTCGPRLAALPRTTRVEAP